MVHVSRVLRDLTWIKRFQLSKQGIAFQLKTVPPTCFNNYTLFTFIFAAHETFVNYKSTLPPDSPPNVTDPVFTTRSKGSGDVDDALEEVVPTLGFFEVSKDLECAATQGGFKA